VPDGERLPVRVDVECRISGLVDLLRAVGLHGVDLAVAIAKAGEDDPPAVRRPRRLEIKRLKR
jgi:hypothetical protein